jgi:hypothetical protein
VPLLPRRRLPDQEQPDGHIETVHEKRRTTRARTACPASGVAFGRKSTQKTQIETVHENHACPYYPGVAFGEKGSLTKHVDHVHLKLEDSVQA